MMKSKSIFVFLAAAWSAMSFAAKAVETITPIATPDLMFDEADGIVSMEAEHFNKQTLTEKRAWHIVSTKSAPDLKPDADPAHLAGASGGAYVEILPDNRAQRTHEMIYEENFTDQPGALAVVHYKVNINTPGRYYVWLRSFSTGSEDNGTHVGLNGQWPESGQRWQTVNKNAWAWDCKQRTVKVHNGVPMQLFLDIDKAGENEIMFSLREDGFEMDKIVLSRNKEFKPEGLGPAVKVKAGTLPAAFSEMAEAAPVVLAFPKHWGEPPTVQTRDLRPLPGGFGRGSGTLAKWIQDHLDKDAAAMAGALILEAKSFPLEDTGYYLDQGKWLAINPEMNKTALARRAFPFPSGRYDVTLEAVGEEDGKSTFTVAVNDRQIGAHECPLSSTAMEEGAAFNMTWRNQAVNSGDIIAVGSTIASADGVEYSRARSARITFVPADEETKAANAKAQPAARETTGMPLLAADQSSTDLLDASLSQWEVFMGVPHSTVVGLPEGTPMSEDGMKGTPLGLNNDPKKVFSVISEDGNLVLKVSGEIFGGLTTKKSHANYLFETEFKWGEQKWAPRLGKKRDSGILYHCQGEHGKFWNVWKASLEYQVQESDLGDFIALSGPSVKSRSSKEKNKLIHDPAQPWEVRPGYIEAKPEPDAPHGEWNKLQLYVLGDSAIHVVNGVVVMSVADARDKQRVPLTSGQLQIQSEAAECYYRKMRISPIESFPKDHAKKAGLSLTGGIATEPAKP